VTPYRLEPMHGADLNMVMDSWLKSYCPLPHLQQPTREQLLERTKYFRNQRALVERCIRDGEVTVARAKDIDIAGWCCHGPGAVIHFVYAKELVRGFDVGTSLVEHAIGHCTDVSYTHDTPQWRGLMRSLQRRKARSWRHAECNAVGVLSGRSGDIRAGSRRVGAGDRGLGVHASVQAHGEDVSTNG
jgi:GNAT superfamily N-acetyltransferase